MASELRQPVVYSNFRPARHQRRKKEPASSKRPGMDDQHRKHIKLLPCCVCGKPGASDGHHLKQGTGERGAGLRSTDRWLVPLCRPHHDECERAGSRNEARWFLRHGFDGRTLAERLWAARGDVVRMHRVLTGTPVYAERDR